MDDVLTHAICAAVGLAKKTLDKYYSLTDASKVYRIAMGRNAPLPYDYGIDSMT